MAHAPAKCPHAAGSPPICRRRSSARELQPSPSDPILFIIGKRHTDCPRAPRCCCCRRRCSPATFVPFRRPSETAALAASDRRYLTAPGAGCIVTKARPLIIIIFHLLSIIANTGNVSIRDVSASALPAGTQLAQGGRVVEPFRFPLEPAAAAAAVHQKDNQANHEEQPPSSSFSAGDRWQRPVGGAYDYRDGGGQSLASNLNKTLTLLDRTSNDSGLLVEGMQRQLIRQLTSLIMNHEPERIAQRMEGTRVSGQLVSESELLEEATTSSSIALDLANAIIGDIPQQQQPNGATYTLATGSPLGPSMLVAGSGSSGIDADDDNLIQDVQPEDHISSEAAGGSKSSNDSNDKGSSQQQQQQQEDGYVTCSPDYEDGTINEISSNLTVEQQQQLLAGADSSGLLTVNGSTAASSQQPGEQPQEMGQSGALAPRPPSLCVMPGSRMIEVITKVITPILFSIIIVVGLLGNIIVMIVILEDRKTEREYTPTGLLILDLSLADLSFIIFCIPFTAWDYSVGHWVFGSLWCNINQYLIVVTALSSIYTLVLMSVDRFMAVVYPIECMSYRTSKNTLYAIYIKWILILAMASPTFAMHGLIDSPAAPDQFTCRFLADQYNPLHFQIVFFITSYLFPLILIFCLYLSLLNKLWFGNKPHGHKESLKTLESKKKVTLLVASIVVLFALCWCPIQVMLILMRLKTHKITATYVAVQVLSHTLGYTNSCVNPIVYAFASESFHNSFKRSSVGRFCYSLLCIKNTGNHHNHRPSNSTYNNNHNQDHERASQTNFRTIHHNSSNNNNNDNNNNNNAISDTSFQHHQQPQHTHPPQDQRPPQQPNHPATTTTTSPSTLVGNASALGIESSLSASTALTTTPSNGRHNDTRVVPTLEPRDRVLSLTGIIDATNPSQINSIEGISSHDNALTSTQGHISQSLSAGGLTQQQQQQQAPAKQQLVARMVQSGNQAPCYQQELLKSS